MKNFHYAAFLILGILAILNGCNNPQRQGPKETAEAFLTALQNGDYDRAKEYCTESSRSNLSMFETFSGFGANPFAEAFEITKEEKDGDYSKVYYTTDKEDEEKYVRLRNDGGRWEVIANKGDMTKSDKTNSTDNFSKGNRNILGNDDNGMTDQEKVENKYRTVRAGKTAREIGEAFLDAMMFNDTDEAEKYASHSSQAALGMQALSEKSSFEDYKTIRVEEKGKYAKLFYVEKGETEEKVLKLGKDGNDNWQVLMSKDDDN